MEKVENVEKVEKAARERLRRLRRWRRWRRLPERVVCLSTIRAASQSVPSPLPLPPFPPLPLLSKCLYLPHPLPPSPTYPSILPQPLCLSVHPLPTSNLSLLLSIRGCLSMNLSRKTSDVLYTLEDQELMIPPRPPRSTKFDIEIKIWFSLLILRMFQRSFGVLQENNQLK